MSLEHWYAKRAAFLRAKAVALSPVRSTYEELQRMVSELGETLHFNAYPPHSAVKVKLCNWTLLELNEQRGKLALVGSWSKSSSILAHECKACRERLDNARLL